MLQYLPGFGSVTAGGSDDGSPINDFAEEPRDAPSPQMRLEAISPRSAAVCSQRARIAGSPARSPQSIRPGSSPVVFDSPASASPSRLLQAERQYWAEITGRQQRGEGEGRQEGPRERKGQRSPSGRKGRQQMNEDTSPEGSEGQEWRDRWRRGWVTAATPLSVLSYLWRCLPGSGTGLGRLAAAQLEEGVPPEEDSSMLLGDDLFPINVNEVIREVGQDNKDLAEAAALAVTSLNNMAFGGDPDRVPLTTGRLTTTQKMAMSHVIEALVALDESEEDCPSFDDSALALRTARFDYQGEPVMVMEDLEADKVIAAWPRVGGAAIQDATSFLTGDLKDRLLSPEKVLKPLHEWPEKPHQSKVRASDAEWRKIVEAGPHVFRRLFTSYMGVLGFQPDDYAPYCLRRGGATWYFQSTLSYDATIARGRWACVKTARQYIDEGTMQLAHVSWNRSQRRLVKRWQTSCRQYRLRQE
eukprot:Skav236394  [mRNA]  locus=scaffold29:273428:287604:+ [translate_table: standard]